jgi:hypothetical protein
MPASGVSRLPPSRERPADSLVSAMSAGRSSAAEARSSILARRSSRCIALSNSSAYARQRGSLVRAQYRPPLHKPCSCGVFRVGRDASMRATARAWQGNGKKRGALADTDARRSPRRATRAAEDHRARARPGPHDDESPEIPLGTSSPACPLLDPMACGRSRTGPSSSCSTARSAPWRRPPTRPASTVTGESPSAHTTSVIRSSLPRSPRGHRSPRRRRSPATRTHRHRAGVRGADRERAREGCRQARGRRFRRVTSARVARLTVRSGALARSTKRADTAQPCPLSASSRTAVNAPAQIDKLGDWSVSVRREPPSRAREAGPPSRLLQREVRRHRVVGGRLEFARPVTA